jgi:hypothetical protein
LDQMVQENVILNLQVVPSILWMACERHLSKTRLNYVCL